MGPTDVHFLAGFIAGALFVIAGIALIVAGLR